MSTEILDPGQLAALIETFSVLAHKVLADGTLFHTLVEQNIDGLLVVGEEGDMLCANPVAERMFHAASGQLIGKTFGSPIHEGEIAEIDVYNAERRKTRAEVRVTRIEWSGDLAYLLSLRLVQKRNQAKETLRKNTDQLHTVNNASPLAVVALDTNGRITLWNRAATRTFGWGGAGCAGADTPVRTNVYQRSTCVSSGKDLAGRSVERTGAG